MRGLLFALAVGLVGSVSLRADEEKVPLDKVPKAVLEAVKKRFPEAEVKGASTEKEDGKTVYEVTVKEGGKNIDISLTPEGTITGIEKEIGHKDLPKAAAEAVEAKYPKHKAKLIEEVYKVKDGKESLEYFEIALTTADKKKVEVEVSAEGKIIKVEEKKEKEKD